MGKIEDYVVLLKSAAMAFPTRGLPNEILYELFCQKASELPEDKMKNPKKILVGSLKF